MTPAEFAADAGVRALIEAHIETVNADLAQVETIKRFSVLPHPFALERGEGTVHPTHHPQLTSRDFPSHGTAHTTHTTRHARDDTGSYAHDEVEAQRDPQQLRG